MVLSGFANASGFSASWFNHWVVGLTGTIVLVAASALVGMLVHRFEVADNLSNIWLVVYSLFVIMMVFIFLGFLNNFWM
jgi:hypothetical protein